MSGQVERSCFACEGRGWKYVSFRRALIASPDGPVPPLPRVRDICSTCQGLGFPAAA
ncbi:hypothetical protein [Planobispora takensis]|uniref:hypothetical protein n=1 Tax=Planobispora takensis TaxID=1367882 RepID=UPI001941F591|nr:hypothetical protein [Planobispora takensis]